MEWLLSSENLAALVTLTALEIVLGIDNIIFIAILAGKLPSQQQASARFIGLGLAMMSRIALLLSLTWVMSLTKPLLSGFGHDLSGRDLILLGGGLFLIAKSAHEIHEKVEDIDEHHGGVSIKKVPTFLSAMIQITILDLVFSLDSVITAVGMASEVWIMVTAIVIAVAVMMLFSGWLSNFIDKNQALKMLALSFLLLIGFVLMAEGMGQHISKGYIYSAMAFAFFVELLHIRAGSRARALAKDAAEAKVRARK